MATVAPTTHTLGLNPALQYPIDGKQIKKVLDVSKQVRAGSYTTDELKRNCFLKTAGGVALIVLAILIFTSTLGAGTGLAVGLMLGGAKLLDLANDDHNKMKGADSVQSNAASFGAIQRLQGDDGEDKVLTPMEKMQLEREQDRKEQQQFNQALLARLSPPVAATAPTAPAAFVAPALVELPMHA
jgi:hypothetical protein